MLASDLSERVPGRFLIIAHKGYSSAYPENSVDAFEAAIAAGADLVEADLRESADGAIVLSHDDVVGDKTLEQLAGNGIIPLASLLQLTENRIVSLLDIKESSPAFLRKIVDAVNQHDMLDQVVFGVRDVDQARDLQALSPSAVMLGLLSRAQYDFDGFYRAGGHIARLWEADLDPSTVNAARGDGSHPIWITPRQGLQATGDTDRRRQEDLMRMELDGVLVNDLKSAIAVRCSFVQGSK
ncbi:MAG: glycerophosphodiester phosphodiesterase family protein [Alphaproteobacteria bacterium]|nr:glycerophosphodiester phosphodiesterase family protein [Alphaproteobacteria bacterium]